MPHPNRSCREAHNTVYAARLAVATLADLEHAYYVQCERGGEADNEDDRRAAGLALKLIEAVGIYRFGEKWRARHENEPHRSLRTRESEYSSMSVPPENGENQ